MITAALDSWSEVANITFVQVTSGAIKFQNTAPNAYTNFSSSGSNLTSATVNVSSAWIASYGNTIGSYGFQTYVFFIVSGTLTRWFPAAMPCIIVWSRVAFRPKSYGHILQLRQILHANFTRKPLFQSNGLIQAKAIAWYLGLKMARPSKKCKRF